MPAKINLLLRVRFVSTSTHTRRRTWFWLGSFFVIPLFLARSRVFVNSEWLSSVAATLHRTVSNWIISGISRGMLVFWWLRAPRMVWHTTNMIKRWRVSIDSLWLQQRQTNSFSWYSVIFILFCLDSIRGRLFWRHFAKARLRARLYYFQRSKYFRYRNIMEWQKNSTRHTYRRERHKYFWWLSRKLNSLSFRGPNSKSKSLLLRAYALRCYV